MKTIIAPLGRLISRVRLAMFVEPVFYIRPGQEPLLVYATPQNPNVAGARFQEFVVSKNSMIFVFQRSDFSDENGELIRPNKGDVIVRKTGDVQVRYRVTADSQSPHWMFNNVVENEIAIFAESLRG